MERMDFDDLQRLLIKEYGPPVERLLFDAETKSGTGAANNIAINSSSDAKPETKPYRLDNTDLLARYNIYFRTEAAETAKFINIAFALRYQVYCLEREFERAGQYADRLERDEFDSHALHSLLFYRPTEEAIGTARLILPGHGADSLPIQAMLRENGLNAEKYFPIEDTGEVSRFAISNEFRRDASDRMVRDSLTDRRTKIDSRELRGVLPSLGLFQALMRESAEQGITHIVAVMEPKLLRMLSSMGIRLTPIGPLINHHGIRQPSEGYVPEMLDRLRREQPEHWNVVTNGGELCEKMNDMPKRETAT
jgi:N-acyl amino acid synthase of PEP-CTERM/exosortase system